MHRRTLVLAAIVAALGALVPATTAWSSTATRRQTVGYVYNCNNNRVAKLVVSGNATITTNTTPPRIHLNAVKFKFVNNFGPISVSAAQFTVPDPNNTSAPYLNNSAGPTTTTPWSAAHAAGALDANFAPSTPLALANGAQLVNAPVVHARYKDLGPATTVIAFRPGTFTITEAPSTVVTCHLQPGTPQPFAQVTE